MKPMLLQLHFYLPPAKGQGWEIMKSLLCACMCVCACVLLTQFYLNVYVSFIYENIFSRFAGNVYSCENMFAKNFILILKKQHGHHC